MPKQLIAELGAGDVFHFESLKNENNTGYYFKVNSEKNKAVNLQSFKTFVFDATDEGTPVQAELKLDRV